MRSVCRDIEGLKKPSQWSLGGLDCASATGVLQRAISAIKIVERCLLPVMNDGVVILAHGIDSIAPR